MSVHGNNINHYGKLHKFQSFFLHFTKLFCVFCIFLYIAFFVTNTQFHSIDLILMENMAFRPFSIVVLFGHCAFNEFVCLIWYEHDAKSISVLYSKAALRLITIALAQFSITKLDSISLQVQYSRQKPMRCNRRLNLRCWTITWMCHRGDSNYKRMWMSSIRPMHSNYHD